MTNEAQQELKERLKAKHAPPEEEKIVDDDGDAAELDDMKEAEGGRRYTYDAALAKKGISRDTRVYQDSIHAALMWLRLNRPFYGFIIDEMTLQITQKTATAHVEVSSTGVAMALNPDFLALLPLRHRVGVIMHECLHIMNLHISRLKSAIGAYGRGVILISNIAADLAVNSLLSDPRDLPKFALRPEAFHVHDGDENTDRRAQFPARSTYEHYLSLLRQLGLQGIRAQIASMPGRGGGAPEPDGGFGEGGVIILDDHDPWLAAQGAAVDSDLLNEVIRDRIRRATNKAAGRGVTPGDLQAVIDELLADKAVNFAALFAGLIGRYVSQIRRTSMMRRSRRYPVPPGRVMGRKLDVRYYQDTSGSMSMQEIHVGLSEAAHAEESGLAKVTIQQFDFTLQGKPLSVQDMGKVEVGVKGRGGTSLRDVIADIDRHQPDLAVISTDGGLEHDIKPKTQTPVAWVLTAHGADPGWGQAVRLPTLEEIKAGKKAQMTKR